MDLASSALRPTRAQVIDAAFLVALGTVAVLGFASTFTGSAYLVAGAVGLVLGVLVTHVARALAQPLVVVALLTVTAYFLVGGAVSLHSEGLVRALPLPGTLATLADQAVNGWKELLTTLPPVDSGPLLVLPYLLGLVCGAGGATTAERSRSALLPAAWPAALLAAVILLGVPVAGDLALVGGLFSLGTVLWVVERTRRQRPRLRLGQRQVRRPTAAAALCAGAAGLGVLVGPALPGLAEDRTVLRTFVEPPFDVGQYGSPLASFRQYTKEYKAPRRELNLYDDLLFTVEGLPGGSRLRLAALDDYSGTVWGAANDSGVTAGRADTFLKVGSVLDNPQPGPSTEVEVTLAKGYSGVWLPTAGALQSIDFLSPRLAGQTEEFRYNLASSTGIVPGGLQEGDAYRFTASLSEQSLDPDDGAGTDQVDGADLGARFQPLAIDWADERPTALAQVLAVAKRLRSDGTYADGVSGGRNYPAGHSLRRLSDFVAPDSQIVGNDEQYAAMMALLANQLGVPARVVLGAVVPEDGKVRGRDVHAWVELQTADARWRTLPTEAFMDPTKKPEDEQPQPQKAVAGQVVPPPAPVRPPSSVGDPVSDTLNQQKRDSDPADDGFSLPAWVRVAALVVLPPVALVGAVVGGILLLKRRRRERRRTEGTPADQVASGWRELLDHLRDLGHPVHLGLTRREQARLVDRAEVHQLARTADARVFGAADPGPRGAEDYWRQVDEARIAFLEGLGRRARLKAALNPVSLRRPARLGGSS